MTVPSWLIFGLGYTGRAVADRVRAGGGQVVATVRRPGDHGPVAVVAFDQAAPAIAAATHILVTAAPDAAGDPVLARYTRAIAAAPVLRWIGYLSTTGVYGDRGGAWVDETTPPAPSAPRGQRRLAAEQGWRAIAVDRPLDLIRLAGIYGPGRSVFDDLRAGTARPIAAPDHRFGRIHRDDIAGMVLAAAATAHPGTRVLHGNDDEPAASADVIAEAARLLGIAPPQARPLAAAWPTMSPMARSFWSENRRVASVITQAALGRRWTYPTYREGLRAILAAERGEQAGERAVEQG